MLPILLLLAAWAWADVADDLRQGAEGITRRDFDAAAAACRRALEAAAATPDECREALDGLLVAAIESGRAAELVPYLEERRAKAPAAQSGLFLAAVVRCQKALDGHLQGALAKLAPEATKSTYSDARRISASIRSALASLEAATLKQLKDLRAAAQEPGRPAAPAPRTRLRCDVTPIRVPVPELPRLGSLGVAAVVKPPPNRVRGPKLAPLFFNHFYQKATELAAQGFFESAKAEYATIMQLFPDSPQAEQAARYAIQLFQRERGANQGPDALVAYLQWLRAVLGPKGCDYAEYMAFRTLSRGVDASVVAREAEAFLARHADSKWVPQVRLRLAMALDDLGAPARAVEALKPLARQLDTALGARAAHVLAWLYIFQGDAASARPVLESLAAQTASPSDATAARRLLEQLAARPIEKIPLPPQDAEAPEDALAAALLKAGDAFLAKGDPERAMDLYALYLHTSSDTPGYWQARQRIERLKQTGRADEP